MKTKPKGRKKAQEAQSCFVRVERVAQGLDSSDEWIDLGDHWGPTVSARFYELRRELMKPYPGVAWKDVRLVERTVIEVVLQKANLPTVVNP